MTSTPPEIVMFARRRLCGDCARSRSHLEELGIPWTERDIDTDPAAAEETERLTGGRSVPTIVIGDSVLVEPSNNLLNRALVAAGYDIDED